MVTPLKFVVLRLLFVFYGTLITMDLNDSRKTMIKHIIYYQIWLGTFMKTLGQK